MIMLYNITIYTFKIYIWSKSVFSSEESFHWTFHSALKHHWLFNNCMRASYSTCQYLLRMTIVWIVPYFCLNVYRCLVPGPINLLSEIALRFDSGNIFWLFLISYFLCNETSNLVPEKNAVFIYFSSTELLKAS